MKITKQQLIEWNACLAGLKRFIDQTNDTDQPVEVLSLIGGENTIGDWMWLVAKTLPEPEKKVVRFACDCALLNVELVKPYCSDSDYEGVVGFLHEPTADDTDENITVLAGAARVAKTNYDAAAYAAAYAAIYAVEAVHHYVIYDYKAAACAAERAAIYTREADACDAGGRKRVNELLKELFS